MNQARIDPREWLEAQDPDCAALQSDPFSFSRDVLLLGTDELMNHGGDLSRALSASPDCRAEIVLAWLAARALEDGPAAATDGIMLAARIVGRLNARTSAA